MFFYITIALLFCCNEVLAATSFESSMCNAYNIATGPAGKVIGALAITSLGVGFFTGKISWKLMIAVSLGIGALTSAPQIVAIISGKDKVQCASGTYYTTCANGECYSCPIGYGGPTCDSCGVGFTGPTCSDCDVGYKGKECSECDVGYNKYRGVCHKDCQISQPGSTKKVVKGGVDSLTCDAANFTGSINYSCLDGTFKVLSGSCVCVGNYTGANCSTCLTGYTIISGCVDCDTNYTKVDSVCHKDCSISSSQVEGVKDKAVLPITGILGCDASGYSGNLQYTCQNGNLTIQSGQSCTNNMCLGGNETFVTISGKLYRLHIFNSNGNFSCPVAKNIEYLVVGGGGGGGSRHGGGGGAGGFVEGDVTLTARSTQIITVGSGGSQNNKGVNSSIGNLVVAYGGGRGSNNGTSASSLSGGSGGGGSNKGDGGTPISGQGNKGGNNPNSGANGFGSGGGGAGEEGGSASDSSLPADGGAGKISSITGVSQYYAGGGGGGSWFTSTQRTKTYGNGGSGIGGNGGDGTNMNGGKGADGTGSGGGGGGATASVNGTGGAGGSGIVIIRYPL